MLFTAALRRAATIRSQHAGIIDGPHSKTWSQIQQDTAALAGALRTAGLQPGDKVATLALNSPRYFELMLAVWWAGGVLVPLNTRLAFEELRYILEHVQAPMLIVDEHFSKVAIDQGGQATTLERILVFDRDLYRRMVAHPPIDDTCPGLEALAGIFYTGGTTGHPKGVELSHQNLAFAATNMQRDLRHDTTAIYLHAAPMFHLADFGIGLGVTLGAGAHSFIAEFSLEEFYRRLREDGITHLQLVPTMLSMVLDAPQRDDKLLAQIRSISYGAAPISQALLARVLQAFPNALIQQFYGMTECAGACVMLPSEYHVTEGPLAGRLQSAGQATAGFEVRIMSASGQPCAAGEVGEIQIRGPAVMRGYWRDPASTEAALVDSWLCSGDMGYMDTDGFIYIVDRLKDMIISGGENIYCTQVEDALNSHPAVAASAVFGIPDPYWGEKVHAAVVLKPDSKTTFAELDTHCRSRIAAYKVPRSYEFRSLPLPLSGVGKVQKIRLRDEWLAQQETSLP